MIDTPQRTESLMADRLDADEKPAAVADTAALTAAKLRDPAALEPADFADDHPDDHADEPADHADEAVSDDIATDEAAGGSPAERQRRRKRKKQRSTGICALTGREVPRRELFPLEALRPQIQERIWRDHPELSPDSLIWRREIDRLRTEYIGEILRTERGELSVLEREVVASLAEHDAIAENVEDDFEQERSFGERVSDRMATFGGSWAFLISFGMLLLVWMAYNAVRGEATAFDPYPFILLNLVLSCLAAIQAPIIMMSQKRSEAKDRLRALNDYRVNLKAELEIRHLHEKMDHVLKSQWERLAEMQEIQLELLQELDRRSARRR